MTWNEERLAYELAKAKRREPLMRRLFVLSNVLWLLALLTACTTDMHGPQARRYWGDLTGDGTITILDADLVVQHAVGFSITVDTLPGDVDDDRAVTTRDALFIRTYVTTGVAPTGTRIGEAMP